MTISSVRISDHRVTSFSLFQHVNHSWEGSPSSFWISIGNKHCALVGDIDLYPSFIATSSFWRLLLKNKVKGWWS